jgi:hypothetical protein
MAAAASGTRRDNPMLSPAAFAFPFRVQMRLLHTTVLMPEVSRAAEGDGRAGAATRAQPPRRRAAARGPHRSAPYKLARIVAMETLPVTEAKNRFTELADRAALIGPELRQRNGGGR